MTLSSAGLDRIKRYEACSLVVYDDQAGLATIGWGHLIKKGEDFSNGITEDAATELLIADLKSAIEGVTACLEVEVTQEQFDSLVSFAFNCGVGALRSSSLLRAINSKESFAAIRECLMRWDKITVRGQKVRSEGLARRREDEARAWL